jgi:pyruvate,water dikinase
VIQVKADGSPLKISSKIRLTRDRAFMTNREIRWFEKTGRGDVASVGGKNASLGEMVRSLSAKGIQVPGGFATTADAYWRYLDENDLRETIAQTLADMESGRSGLAETGQGIRSTILGGT